MAATEEAAAIGFILSGSDQFAVGNHDVHTPDWFVIAAIAGAGGPGSRFHRRRIRSR